MIFVRCEAFDTRRGGLEKLNSLELVSVPWGSRALKHAHWKRKMERGPSAACDCTWTRELILPELMDRSHGEISFRFTQLPMVHGGFDCYLHRINRVPTLRGAQLFGRVCITHSYSAKHSKMKGKYSFPGRANVF